MKSKLKPVLAVFSGLFILGALAILGGLTNIQTTFVACVVLPILAGFAFRTADRSEHYRYTLFISGPLILAFGGVLVFQWSWMILTFLPFALSGAFIGLLIRKWVNRSHLRDSVLLAGSYLLIGAVILFTVLPTAMRRDFTEVVNQPVPSFELITLDKESVQSSELQGKVIVFDFWATWCSPCIKQFPAFEKLQDKYKDNSEVYIAAVNTSWKNSMEDARTFVEENSLGVPVLYDSSATLTNKLDISGIPHTVIIGKNSNLRVQHTGYSPGIDFVSIMDDHIEKLLDE